MTPLVLERVPEPVRGETVDLHRAERLAGAVRQRQPPQFCRLYGCPELTSVPVESHITMIESNPVSSSAAIRHGAGHRPQKASRSTIELLSGGFYHPAFSEWHWHGSKANALLYATSEAKG